MLRITLLQSRTCGTARSSPPFQRRGSRKESFESRFAGRLVKPGFQSRPAEVYFWQAVAAFSLFLLRYYYAHMSQVVFIDVDDTLVRSAGAKRIPIPAVIARVRQLKQEGAILFLWSTGGDEYCQSSATELGIADCFAGFLPKPNVYIDDQPVHEWKSCKHLYPSQAGNL